MSATSRAAHLLRLRRRATPRAGLLIAAGWVLLAALWALPPGVAAGASTTPMLTNAGPNSGPPGTAVTFVYTWNYNRCAGHSPDPAALTIVLAWDNTPPEKMGSNLVTVDAATNQCGGSVSGNVPSDAVAGSHLPTAYLTEPGGATVSNSTATAAPAYTVTPGPTPTATPSPTPTPTATPTPSPTPTATPTPTPTPTATPSDIPTPTDVPTDTPSDIGTLPATPTPTAQPGTLTPTGAGQGGGSTPPGVVLVVGVVAVVVALAALATLFLIRRRGRRRPPPDPFQFVR